MINQKALAITVFHRKVAPLSPIILARTHIILQIMNWNGCLLIIFLQRSEIFGLVTKLQSPQTFRFLTNHFRFSRGITDEAKSYGRFIALYVEHMFLFNAYVTLNWCLAHSPQASTACSTPPTLHIPCLSKGEIYLP